MHKFYVTNTESGVSWWEVGGLASREAMAAASEASPCG